MQDTFFVEGGRILRSHTSPVQIRTMLAGPPPIRDHRARATSSAATTTPRTRRCSRRSRACYVDEDVSFADLKGTLLHFVHALLRHRTSASACARATSRSPSRRPRSTPPATCAAGPGRSGGRTCRLCKGSGWIEIGGSGMVHPNVFRAVGYDPETVTGLRVRHGAVAHGDAEVRRRRPALVLRERRPLPGAVPVNAGATMKISFNWLRELVALPPGVTADSVARAADARRARGRVDRAPRPRSGGRRRRRGPRHARRTPPPTSCRIVRVVAGGARGGGRLRRARTCRRRAARSRGRRPGATLPAGRKLDRKEVRGVLVAGHAVQRGRSSGIGEGGDGILILSTDAPVGAGSAPATSASSTRCSRSTSRRTGRTRCRTSASRARWPRCFGDDAGAARARRGPGGARCRRARRRRRRSATRRGCPRYLARIVTGPPRRAEPARDARAARGLRRPRHLQPRRRHQLRDARDRPPAARVRPRQASRGDIQIRRAGARRAHDDARRRRAPAAGGDLVIADDARRGRARGRDGRRRSRGLGRDDAPCCSRRRRSIRARSGARPSGSGCTARRRTASSAASTPTASRTRAAARPRCSRVSAGGAVAGEAVDRYPRAAEPRRGDAVDRAGSRALAGFEIPLAQAAREAAPRSASPPQPTARRGAAARRDRPELPPRHHDRGGSGRGGHAPARLRPRRPRACRAGAARPAPSPEGLADRARDLLAALGLPARSSAGPSCRAGWLAALGAPAASRRSREGIVVKNPISADYELMRTSLLPGLVDAARRNLARGVADVGLFEVGPVVRRARPTPRTAPVEPSHAGRHPGRAARRLAQAGRRRSTSSTPSASPSSCLRGARRRRRRVRRAARRRAVAPPGRRGRHPRSTPPRAPRRPGRRGPPAPRARARPRRAGPLPRDRARRRRRRAPRPCAACRRRGSRPSRATSRSGSTPAVTADAQRALLLVGRRAAAARAGRAGGLPRSAHDAGGQEGDALDADLPPPTSGR